jgi:hypothetical protein
VLYALLWLGMLALHQDFRYARDATLVLGFLPIGLAYHVGYTLFAAGVMGALVRFAWPGQLEHLERENPPPPGERGAGG